MNIFSCAASILKMLEDPSSSTSQASVHLLKTCPVIWKSNCFFLVIQNFLLSIDNNLILKASIKYIMTINRFSVLLFWYCFLSLALNIYIHFFPSGVHPLPTLFSLSCLREQWGMCLCCIFLSLFWLSLCKIFFIYFLSCPIVINYIAKKRKV